MSPGLALAYLAIGTLGLIVILVFTVLMVAALRPTPAPEPKPCARCGHVPGTDVGSWRKPS